MSREGRDWRRIARRIGIVLIALPLLVILGLSLASKLTVAKDVPLSSLIQMVSAGLWDMTGCRVFECDATLVEGLEIETFAEDLVRDTTVALDVDERGRVFIAESARQRGGGVEDNRSHPYWLLDDLASRTIEDRQRYYEKALAEGRFERPDHFTRLEDRVVMLEDRDGDGVADARTRIAGWNEIVSGLVAGVEAREGDLWVTSIPSVHRIRDTDGDGIPDTEEELHRGFGVKTSLGGHDLHGLVFGPDGKIYFSMGDRGYSIPREDGSRIEPPLGPGRGAIFRMNPDGSELQVFATGVRNPQELAFDDYGNLFTGDNNGDGGDRARLVYLVEGGETGWAMPYQSLADDYVRGPWVAERLWELQHATQPAWVLPPVAYLGNGPAGFVHYPGIGLPERYAGHFFLCDYGYVNSRSGVWSFAVEPRGASFEMVDLHEFAWGMLTTDIDFGWDGRLYTTVFDQIRMTQSIARLTHSSRADARELETLAALAQRKMSNHETHELVSLLEFPDQRLRIRAQSELAHRRAIPELVAMARDARAGQIARLHALWGLGQIGEAGLRALAPSDLAWAGPEQTEFRAQLAKVVGVAKADWLMPSLLAGLEDSEARVRFFSAQSLGALGRAASVPALFELIRRNADEDVFLRHAAVYALSRIGDLEAVWSRRDDASRAVRMAVLLVLRRAEDPRIAHFLSDEDSLLGIEAARAIYDVPIDAAMPSLAALAGSLGPAAEDDRQSGRALHRRVLGANVRLRTEEGALRLARYAADEAQLLALRSMALEALATFDAPPPRDWTMGFYRPLDAVSDEVVRTVLARVGRELIDSSLGSRALEIATEFGVSPYDASELLAISRDVDATVAARVAALGALVEDAPGEAAAQAAKAGLESTAPRVRIAARGLLMAVDPEAGRAEQLRAARSAPTVAEQQAAWQAIGAGSLAPSSAVSQAVEEALASWEAGGLPPAVALEILRAGERHPVPAVAARAQRLLAPATNSAVARGWALDGGDPLSGRSIYQTTGDCQRCHGGGSGASGAGGHGGGVGPSLVGVRARGAEYVLESIVNPQAEIAAGYGNVTVTLRDGGTVSGALLAEDETGLRLDVGGDAPMRIAADAIAARSEPASGMPPIGLALSPEDLRDLVAYVMSLSEKSGARTADP